MNKAEEYDLFYKNRPNRLYSMPNNRMVVAELGQYPHEYVLDLGCGVGNNLAHLAKVWPEAYLYGVDISSVALEYARAKLPRAYLYQGDLETIQLPPENFDIIFLLGVLEHLPRFTEVLRRIHSWLKDEGKVFVLVPTYQDQPTGVFARLSFGGEQEEWNFSQKNWEDFLREAGFRIVKQVENIALVRGRDLCWILEKDNGEKA